MDDEMNAADEYSQLLCNVRDTHSAIAENKVSTRWHLFAVFIVVSFPYLSAPVESVRPSSNWHLSQWLNMKLHACTQTVFHDESSYSWNVWHSRKDYVSYTWTLERVPIWRTIFSQITQQRFLLSEWNCYIWIPLIQLPLPTSSILPL